MGVLAIAAVGGMVAALLPPRVPEVVHASPPAPALSDNQPPPAADANPPAIPDPGLAPTPPKAALATTININTATQAQLELLPGIGPALAMRIIEYRDKHGGFKSVQALDEVKGIGPKTLAKLQPLVRVKD